MPRTRTAVLLAGSLVAGGSLLVSPSSPASADDPTLFRLQMLHASDLEGGVAAIGRAPNFAAIVDKLEDEVGNDHIDASITLSAGDNVIPGPFFSAAGDGSLRPVLNDVYEEFFGLVNDVREGPGRVDYSIMNVLEFDASAIGNHEWDLGSDVFEANLEPDLRGAGNADDRWFGTQFPYLSANLDFSADGDVGSLFTDELLTTDAFANAPDTGPKIAPSVIIEEAGEQIGVVGATTPLLETISSPTGTTVIGPTTNDLPALAAVLQPEIDELLAAGVNKVILVSHLQQFSLEQALAPLLDGVDLIVAGGSDTILANPDDVLLPGATAEGPYPFVGTSGDGDPVAIVSTDGEYSYVGRLVVDFDANGVLVAPDGTPLDEVGDLDPTLNGPVASTEANVISLWGDTTTAFALGTKGELVDRLIDAVENVVSTKDGNVFGETEVFIDGRRSEVRTQETTLGNLSADANLAVAREYDPTVAVSIKNGGGIRAEIGEVRNVGDTTEFLPPQLNPASGKQEGQISQLDIENSLRFNNSLSVLTTTASGLLALVEHGVSATAPGVTPGQFPQVGGMEFAFDPTAPAGDRVQSLVIVDDDGDVQDVVVVGSEVQGDPNREIRLVTLGFLADGGDSYPFAVNTVAGSRVDLDDELSDVGAAEFAAPGTEQDAFAEYLVDNFGIGAGTPYNTADTPPSGDERIQILGERNDAIADATEQGGPGSEALLGSGGDDIVLAAGGNDTVLAFGGNDYADGGTGNDLLIGGFGDDLLLDGPGNDIIIPGPGADRIVVGDGGALLVLGFDPDEDVIDFGGRFADEGDLADAIRTRFGSTRVQIPDGGTVVLGGVRRVQLEPGVNALP